MAGPALLLVSHGSRDPRHAATVRALAGRIRRGRPGVTVTTAFLEFDAPGVAGALAELRRAGAGSAVAVPLLLTRAYHAKTDLPSALAGAGGPRCAGRRCWAAHRCCWGRWNGGSSRRV
ncbi:hypothetical protein SHKM778_26170 [Streptomyces sp. KM77-8]|uniref:Cobalamin biosynthesis protein CbiX n=1 Tax=Streptomyces haneummycinicus TaxID=3074435 RepID=A0AAT9HFG1_9ACTN